MANNFLLHRAGIISLNNHKLFSCLELRKKWVSDFKKWVSEYLLRNYCLLGIGLGTKQNKSLTAWSLYFREVTVQYLKQTMCSGGKNRVKWMTSARLKGAIHIEWSGTTPLAKVWSRDWDVSQRLSGEEPGERAHLLCRGVSKETDRASGMKGNNTAQHYRLPADAMGHSLYSTT